jgi:hypothetical protein
MACCGQSREMARSAAPIPSKPAVQEGARQGAASARGSEKPVLTGAVVRLRYTGSAGISVRGPNTGRSYAFSRATPEQMVDRRDADAFLRMALFRRV